MKPYFKFTVAISAVVILLSSCGKSNDKGKMIPASAVVVAQVNLTSMGEHLSWNDIKQTAWYQKAFSNTTTPEWRKKILENPATSGIDFDKGLVFFAVKGSGNDFMIVAEGEIKSDKDFEQFNKNFDPTQEIRKVGDIKLVTLKDKNVVGWNGTHFAYVMNSRTTASEMYSSKDPATAEPYIIPAGNTDALSDFCVKLFALKSDSSLEKNEKFGDLLEEKGDIHVWQNTEEIIKNAPTLGPLAMLKLDAFFKHNISTYTILFNRGKVEVNQKGYAGKELTGILKKYMVGKINTGMIRNIPSANVFAVLSANFRPEGIRELIELSGTDGFVNMYGQQMGFTLDDIVKSNNGNVLLAFTDLGMTSDSFNLKDHMGNDSGKGQFSKPHFNYIFSVGINDKTRLEKLLNAGKKMSAQLGKDSFIKYDMSDKTFAISNSTALAQQYVAGGNNQYDFTQKINGHPVGVFVDFHKIFSMLATATANKPATKAMVDENLKTWNNLIMTGGDYKDGGFTAHTEINMTDKNTNSLQQLNKYLDDMYQLAEARKGKDSGNNLDSLLTPPPIDTVK